MNITILSNAWIKIENVEFYNRSADKEQPLEVNQHLFGWDFKTENGFFNVADNGFNLQQAIDHAKKLNVLK